MGIVAKQLHMDFDYHRHLLLLKTSFKFQHGLNISHCVRSHLPGGYPLSCNSIAHCMAEEFNHKIISFIILIMPQKLLH